MKGAEAIGLFDRANNFWSEEGCYHLALPLYLEALKYDPTDPVMLYQLAIVLRAFERFDEAVQALTLAEQYQILLSKTGRQLLDRRKKWLLKHLYNAPPLPVPAIEIDLKQFLSKVSIIMSGLKLLLLLVRGECFFWRKLPMTEVCLFLNSKKLGKPNKPDLIIRAIAQY